MGRRTYFRESECLRRLGTTPESPDAMHAGDEPLYTATSLKRLAKRLLDEGRIERKRFDRLMKIWRWLK